MKKTRINGFTILSLALILSFSFTGCVTKGTYMKQVDENQLQKKQISDLTAQSEKQQQEIAQLNQAIKARSEDLSRQRGQITQLEKQKEKVQETSKTYSEMLEKMKSEVEKGQVTITELKGKLTVNMVESILFDSGKAEVKKDGLNVLNKVVDVLKDVKDKAIRIEGHTDNVKIGGVLAKRYPTNWELSAARAINVAKYLQKQGIDPALLSACGFGEYKPIGSNETAEGRAKNRRIEIILVPKD